LSQIASPNTSYVHSQSNLLRKKKTTDFNIPYVTDVIRERINKPHNNLEPQPNPLL